jgi:hypothetical protein
VPASRGAVGSAVSGFVARANARTYRALNERNVAQEGAIRSGVGVMKALGELRDLHETLDDEQADREDARDENAHRREMAKRRRKLELELIEAQDEKRRQEIKAELEVAKDNTIYATRRREAAEQAAPHYVDGAVHRVAAEARERELGRKTVEAGLARRFGGEGQPAPAETTVNEDVALNLIDTQIAQAVAENNIELVLTLSNLKAELLARSKLGGS